MFCCLKTLQDFLYITHTHKHKSEHAPLLATLILILLYLLCIPLLIFIAIYAIYYFLIYRNSRQGDISFVWKWEQTGKKIHYTLSSHVIWRIIETWKTYQWDFPILCNGKFVSIFSVNIVHKCFVVSWQMVCSKSLKSSLAVLQLKRFIPSNTAPQRLMSNSPNFKYRSLIKI